MGGFVLHEDSRRSAVRTDFSSRLVNVALRVEGVETVGAREYAYGHDLATGVQTRVALSSYRSRGEDARVAGEAALAGDGVLVAIGCEQTRSGTLDAGRLFVPHQGARLVAGGLVRVLPPRRDASGLWQQAFQHAVAERSSRVSSASEFDDAVLFALSEADARGGGVCVRGWNPADGSAFAFLVPLVRDPIGGMPLPHESLSELASRRVFLHGPMAMVEGRAVLDRVRSSLDGESGVVWEVMPWVSAAFSREAAENAAYQPFRDPSSAYAIPGGEEPSSGFLPSVAVLAEGRSGVLFPRLVMPCRVGAGVSLERIPSAVCDPGPFQDTRPGPEADDPLFADALRSFASSMSMMESQVARVPRGP